MKILENYFLNIENLVDFMLEKKKKKKSKIFPFSL
jgi:hypothetical protein